MGRPWLKRRLSLVRKEKNDDTCLIYMKCNCLNVWRSNHTKTSPKILIKKEGVSTI
jgi:hypothetical protein